MAFRGITPASAYWNKLLADEFTAFHLVYAELGNPADDPIRLTDAYKNITMTGQGAIAGTYNTAGGLLNVATFEESLALSVDNMKVSLDGVPGAAISDLLNYQYLDRTVKVWIGLMDDNEVPVNDAILILDGRVSGADIEDSPDKGAAIVAVDVASQWSDFERKGGSRTNDRDHQRTFPGDFGFEFAASSKKQIKWGRD